MKTAGRGALSFLQMKKVKKVEQLELPRGETCIEGKRSSGKTFQQREKGRRKRSGD